MAVGFVELCRSSFAKAFKDRDLLLPPECKLGNGHHPRMLTIARSLETEANLEAALRGFFGDGKTAGEGYPLVWLERNPNRYVQLGRAASQAPAGTPQASSTTSATHLPPYAPGGAQAVTSKSLPELVELMVRHTRREMGDALAPAVEVLDAEAHRAKWEALAIWCCSRTARSRQLGNAGYTPGKAWARALHGWLNRTASRGRGEQWVMGGLISDPEGCWEDGADQ